MNQLIEKKHGDLIRLCKKFHVRRIELFGSATREHFDPGISDLDFLVAFEDLGIGEYADAYFGLLESLQELFHKPIDLIVATAVKNPYFFEEIKKSRTLLYAA